MKSAAAAATPTTIFGMSENAQQQQQKLIKVIKVRRTRQPRNPQLSVARRNERERNRVKMVNNGFALLREHLPVEDLQAFEGSGSDTPTPDGGSVSGGVPGNKSAGNKAKKFSKVETLRAAIQRIKVLEELIRSTDAEFESMNNIIHQPASSILAQQVAPPARHTIHLNMQDEEQLSCGSSSVHSSATIQLQESSQFHYSQQQQPLYSQQHEQFIKIEPQQQSYNNLPSPQNSQSSRTSSGLKQVSTKQVHSQNQQLAHQQMLSSPLSTQEQQQQQSHTHLWIQQHQSSFMEQQQHQYQQQQLNSPQSNNWYNSQNQQQPGQESGNQQDKSNWFVHHHHQQQQQQQQNCNHHLQAHETSPLEQQQQQSQIVESSVGWFNSPTGNNALNNSPSAQISSPQISSPQTSSTSQPIAFSHYHHQHQISLYSQ